LESINVFTAQKATGFCRADNAPIEAGELINFFKGSILCLAHAQELAALKGVPVVNTTGQKPARQGAVSTPVQTVPAAPQPVPLQVALQNAGIAPVPEQLVTSAAVREVVGILQARLDAQASQIESLSAELAATRGLDAQFGGAILALVRSAPAPVKNPDGNTVVAEVPVTVPATNTQCPQPTKAGTACKGKVGESGLCGSHTRQSQTDPTIAATIPTGELAPVTDGAALLPLG
jgi:hypothetical protein